MASISSTPWYRTGTITTNGTETVIGTGTIWATVDLKEGDIFTADGAKVYEIAAVVSDTELTLQALFTEADIAEGSYAIIRNTSISTNVELAARLTQILTRWHEREDNLQEWLGGTADGGPSSDGIYPLTNALGVQIDVKSPARLQADITAIGDSLGNEVGTWTPAIDSLVNITGTVTGAGRYTKIGNIATCVVEFSGADITGTDQETSLRLALPFPAHSGAYSAVGSISLEVGSAPNRFSTGVVINGSNSDAEINAYFSAREIVNTGPQILFTAAFQYEVA
jgi:hypothetical protein